MNAYYVVRETQRVKLGGGGATSYRPRESRGYGDRSNSCRPCCYEGRCRGLPGCRTEQTNQYNSNHPEVGWRSGSQFGNFIPIPVMSSRPAKRVGDLVRFLLVPHGVGFPIARRRDLKQFSLFRSRPGEDKALGFCVQGSRR